MGLMWVLILILLFFDDDALGDNGKKFDASLTTPAINCSGRDMVVLNFTHRFRHSSYPATGKLEISNDGSIWHELKSWSDSTKGPVFKEYNISTYAANEPTVYIKWTYTDDSNFSNYWAIDNVKIYAPPAGTKTISANGGDYLNFTEAITAINTCGIGTGGITFLVSDNEEFIEDPPIITATGDVTKHSCFHKRWYRSKSYINH